MFKERILITFLAILGGIFFSIGLFYLYQKTRFARPLSTSSQNLTPTPQPSPPPFFLNIESPQDEDVTDKKIIPLSGRTRPDATIVISLEDREQVLTPSPEGTFSANITLLDGVNLIEVTAISDEGKALTEKRTVTYSIEKF